MAVCRRSLLVVLTCLLVRMAAFAQEPGETKPHPQSKLETAIPAAIKLLEAKDYVGLLKSFVAPNDLKVILEKGELESFAAKFGETKAGVLLDVLKAVQGQEPELKEDGAEAVFTIPESVAASGKKVIVFARVDKLWYIRN